MLLQHAHDGPLIHLAKQSRACLRRGRHAATLWRGLKVRRQKPIAHRKICKEGLQKHSGRREVVLATHFFVEAAVVGRLECGRFPS
jgi:hypothetical protein